MPKKTKKRTPTPPLRKKLNKTLKTLFKVWASVHIVKSKMQSKPGKTGPSSVFYGEKRKKSRNGRKKRKARTMKLKRK